MSEKPPVRSFTEETYDKAATAYAEKFESIGARVEDVERAFEMVAKANPAVVEIGCGGGREAAYILTRTDNYIGLDISEEMIRLAKSKVPEGNFVRADVNSFEFPVGTDIVFAFASLLHVSKSELTQVLKRVNDALNDGGIVYLSLKRREEYSDEIQTDKFGPRHFFYYTRGDVLEAAGDYYDEVFYEEQERVEPWLTSILRKK